METELKPASSSFLPGMLSVNFNIARNPLPISYKKMLLIVQAVFSVLAYVHNNIRTALPSQTNGSSKVLS